MLYFPPAQLQGPAWTCSGLVWAADNSNPDGARQADDELPLRKSLGNVQICTGILLIELD